MSHLKEDLVKRVLVMYQTDLESSSARLLSVTRIRLAPSVTVGSLVWVLLPYLE